MVFNILTLFFGVPGCGKTTVLTALAQKEIKRIKRGKSKYERVLTNFECDGCYVIDFHDLGVYDIQNSLILLDEITVDADNRDFKNFKKQSVEFFVYHRHYYNDIIMATQQYDAVDKKIRNLTQNLFSVKKGYVLPFIKCKRIFRIVDIDETTHDIVIGYRFANLHEIFLSINPLLNKFLGRITYRVFAPKYWKFFDSHCQPLNLRKFTYKKWHERGFDNGKGSSMV